MMVLDPTVQSFSQQLNELDLSLHPCSLRFRDGKIESMYQSQRIQLSMKLFRYISSGLLFILVAYTIFYVTLHRNIINAVLLRECTFSQKLLFMTALLLCFFFASINFLPSLPKHKRIIFRIFYVYTMLLATAAGVGNMGIFQFSEALPITCYSLAAHNLLPLMIGVPLGIPITDVVLLQVIFQASAMYHLTFSEMESVVKFYLIFVASSLALLTLVASYLYHLTFRVNFMNLIFLRREEHNRQRDRLKIHEEIIHQKGKYIAQVAHDIGTPLQAFSLALELMQSFAISSEMERIITTAECAVELMTVTRKEALDHSKHLEGLELVPTFRPVDLRVLMSKCATIMDGYSGAAELPMSFYHDPMLPKHVFSDNEWIWLMVTNLLSNAKKYSSRGQIYVTVQLLQGPGYFRVEVLDDGIGVPDNRKHFLFKPFGQIMKAAGGTGLGLHGVFLKATKLGGRVGIRDNPMSETGTVFWFEVPFKRTLVDANKEEGANSNVYFQENVLRKEDGSMIKRVLLLGRWDLDSISDSVTYMREKDIHIEVQTDVQQFLKESQCHNDESDAESDKSSNLIHPEDSLDLKRLRSGISYSPLAAAARKSAHRVQEVISGLSLPSSKGSKRSTPNHGSAQHRPKKEFWKSPRSLGSLSSESSDEKAGDFEGYDVVFWMLPPYELLGITGTQQIDLVHQIKHCAKGTSFEDPYLCVVLYDADAVCSPKHSEVIVGPENDNAVFTIKGSSRCSKGERSQTLTSLPQILPPFLKLSKLNKNSQNRKRANPRTIIPHERKPSEGNFQVGSKYAPDENKDGCWTDRSTLNSDAGLLSPAPSSKASAKGLKGTEKYWCCFSLFNKWVSQQPSYFQDSEFSLDASRMFRGSNEDTSTSAQSEDMHMDSTVVVHSSSSYRRSHRAGSTTKNSGTHAYSMKKGGADLVLFRPLLSLDLANILLIKVVDPKNGSSFSCQPLKESHGKSSSGRLDSSRVPDSFRFMDSSSQINDGLQPFTAGCDCKKEEKGNMVLLVDDDMSIRKFTKKMLEKSGYTVVTERNGFDGLTRLKTRIYKIAIIDRSMPVMDGLECVRRFRSWEANAVRDGERSLRQRIIIFSANADAVNIDESIKAGADDFVGKPIKIKEMVQIIEQPFSGRDNLNLDLSRSEKDPHVEISVKSRESREEYSSISKRENSSKSKREKFWPGSTPGSSISRSQIMAQVSHFSDKLSGDFLFSPNKSSSKSHRFAGGFPIQAKKHSGYPKFGSGVAPAPGQRGSILIVDDDNTIRKLADRILVQKGFEVCLAENGQTGLEALKLHRYRAAVIDMNMPIMDGVDCVRNFRKWEQEALASKRRGQRQVIFMCSGAHPDAALIKENIVDIFLDKPIKMNALIEEIESNT